MAKRKAKRADESDAGKWRAAVFAAQGGKCIVTGKRLTNADAGHHVIEAQALRREGLDPFGDPRWGIGVKRRVHERHHTATERIAYERLPLGAIEVAREHNLEHLLERYHPTEGSTDGEG